MNESTMCHGGDCPSKDQCYRFTSRAETGRYFAPPPYEKTGCRYYLKYRPPLFDIAAAYREKCAEYNRLLEVVRVMYNELDMADPNSKGMEQFEELQK